MSIAAFTIPSFLVPDENLIIKEWADHYEGHLWNLYQLRDQSTELMYDDFVYLVYKCTLPRFDFHTCKMRRPLV
jgi:hypothetical protein